jgi:hypothetical protein
MAYGALNSPLPGLTVSPNGCRACGMRGPFLGQDDGTDDSGLEILPVNTEVPEITEPQFVLDTGTGGPGGTPLIAETVPANVSTNVNNPDTIGTNFVSVGGGNYLNLQTGQTVPMSVAQAVTAASTGAGTANLDTTSTDVTGSLIAPTPPPSIATNNLSVAAQALQSAGQLVNAAGQLTAQGQALAASGNLYGTAATAGTAGSTAGTASFTAAINSLGTFLNGSTLIAGVPNWGVLGGLFVGLVVLSNMGGKKRRR